MAVCASLSGAALAAPTTSVSVGAGFSQDSATANGPTSAAVTGTGIDGLGSGAASARADFGNLGVLAQAQATPASAFPTLFASAQASFNDDLFIGGLADTMVSITLELDLNGSCVFTDGATGGFPNAACVETAGLALPPQIPISSSSSGNVTSYTFDWGANTVLPLGGSLNVSGYAWNGSFTANYFDTMKVYAFSSLPDVVITSASGHDYSKPSSTSNNPVPEPATALLLATGLAAMWRRARAH